MDAGQTDRDQTPYFPLCSLCLCLRSKETRLTLRYSAVQFVSPHKWRCKNHHCSVGGLLCAILVTMCTGGYPGVAGTPGASQRHHPCFQLDRVLNTEWSAFYLVMLDWVLLKVVLPASNCDSLAQQSEYCSLYRCRTKVIFVKVLLCIHRNIGHIQTN